MTDKDVETELTRTPLLTHSAALEDVLIWMVCLHCWCQEHKSSLRLPTYLHVANVQREVD